jgi:hypothetical protein
MDFIPYGLVILIAALLLLLIACCCCCCCCLRRPQDNNKSGAKKHGDVSRLESGQLPKLDILTISNQIDKDKQGSKPENRFNYFQVRTPTNVVTQTNFSSGTKEGDPTSRSKLSSQKSQIPSLSSQIEATKIQTKQTEVRSPSPEVYNLNLDNSNNLNPLRSQSKSNFSQQNEVKKFQNDNLRPKPNLNSVSIDFEPRRIDIIDRTSVNPFAGWLSSPESYLN